MKAPHRATCLVAAIGWLAGLALGGPAAQDVPAPGQPVDAPVAARNATLPPDCDMRFWGPIRQTGAESWVVEGRSTLECREVRLQADRMELSDGRRVVAEGNVLVEWGENRIAGSRMTYDLEAERGTIEDAAGQVRDDYAFWARRAEKIGAETVRLESATFTTCTQPTPYWSFAVSSATITLDAYAHMRNVRFRIRKAPVIYLPYLVWPVKEDRALGLLMPELSTSQSRGDSISEELFIPLGRSADLTLLGRYYTEAGFGGGGDLRFVPNRNGSARLSGFYIDDKVAGAGRYNANYSQTQQFRNGFRMLADVNWVSDFDYYSDFERELDVVSLPSILARVEFARNGPWTSLNVRELRREQLFADGTSLVQQTLPEIEWRGRSRRLGRTPLYLTYESSLASIQQRGIQQGDPIDADYLRGDLAPTVSLPIAAAPWLEITPRATYRFTHYTQSRAPTGEATDASLSRRFWSAGIDLVGPKFYRVFERPESSYSKRLKHAIEPRLSYGYQDTLDDTSRILLYDEVDRIGGSGNLLTYALIQRLLAQRPRSAPEPKREAAPSVLEAEGESDREPSPPAADGPAGAPEKEAPLEPVEVASIEIRQSRSFDLDLSSADVDGDGVVESTSAYGPVELIGRVNPNPTTSFDLRSSYDVLFQAFRGATVSGGIRRRLAEARFSLVHRNGLGFRQQGDLFVPVEDDTQVRLTAGFELFRGKLRLAIDGSMDADPDPGQKRFPDKRWQVRYRTQCCEFLFERLSRNFASTTDRQDFYFRVDLSGVGKILDVKY